MRKVLLGLAAVAALAIATPASAKSGSKHHGWHGGGHHGWHGGNHWRGHRHRGPHFSFRFGAPAYAYSGCPVVKKVRIRPNGTRVVRWVNRC